MASLFPPNAYKHHEGSNLVPCRMAKKSLRRIEYMPLDSIKSAKRNPKKHDIELIKASYKRFSAQDSPVLDERTKRLLSGHGRIEALVALRDAGERPPGGIDVKDGEWLVPIQRGGRTKNDKDAEAYILAANKTTELGGWDDDLLSDVLADITNFEGIGFEMPVLEEEPPETPPDDGADDKLPRGKRKSFKQGQVKKVGRHTIVCADCVEYMRTMPADSVDSVLTDPPYLINFQNRDWDSAKDGIEMQKWHTTWLVEALRVLKPGGHLVAFSSTRTIHRLSVAAEDVGFTLRGQFAWAYATGFPRNLDIKKEVARKFDEESAERWDGYGTSTKPSYEPAVVAMKPLDGTFAENVMKHGTGAINIDKARIPPGDPSWFGPSSAPTWKVGAVRSNVGHKLTGGEVTNPPSKLGRWPADIYICPKPPQSEKNAGLDDYEEITGGEATRRKEGSKGLSNPRAGAGRNGGTKAFHPTPKPARLFRQLAKLYACHPGSTILDPFIGSGTSLISSEKEGFACIGIDNNGEYCALSEARIRHIVKASKVGA